MTNDCISIESWKESLDQKNFVAAVLMDLPEAFDSIPHDLLIARIHACGFSRNSLLFFYSYLKTRKQNFSILGPILFNILINDLLLWTSNSELLNLVDDNTICAAESTIEKLITTVENESQVVIDSFKSNEMIVNLDKFQAFIVQENNIINDSYLLNISQELINSENYVSYLELKSATSFLH